MKQAKVSMYTQNEYIVVNIYHIKEECRARFRLWGQEHFRSSESLIQRNYNAWQNIETWLFRLVLEMMP